jgi:hypothetical protein
MNIKTLPSASGGDVQASVSLTATELQILRDFLDLETITQDDVGGWVAEAIQVAWMGVEILAEDEEWNH